MTRPPRTARVPAPTSRRSPSPFHRVSQEPRALYSFYELETPLAPGDKLSLTFKVGYQTRGFRDGNERPELAYNGMFFDSSYFPFIGYASNGELDDPRRRRDHAVARLAHRYASGNDSDRQ